MPEIKQRAIKFRAWIEEDTKFIYPMKLTILADIVYVYDAEADYEYQIEPIHLQQFTGLEDNNDTPIFEGDIVTASDKSWNRYPAPCIGEIRMGNFNGAWQIGRTPWLNLMNFRAGIVPEYDIEVIGNVIENGDLLNAKD